MKKEIISVKSIFFNEKITLIANKEILIYEYRCYNVAREMKKKKSLTIREFIKLKMLSSAVNCIVDGVGNLIII